MCQVRSACARACACVRARVARVCTCALVVVRRLPCALPNCSCSSVARSESKFPSLRRIPCSSQGAMESASRSTGGAR
eukprot:15450177-Alexandrium_andersonii.AAC.1